MTEQLKPCPCCGCKRVVIEQYKKDGIRVICKGCALKREQRVISRPIGWLEGEMIKDWNSRADGWIGVDGAKNIPVGDWMVATCDKESKVDTHIAKCRPNFIVIGGHFHFDMPKVYAYKEIGELPSPPKAVLCGE